MNRGPGVARTVQRLAVLLGAGVAPVTAWRAVAAEPDAPVPARDVGSRLASAHDIPERLVAAARRDGEWAAVAAAWCVADECGAPLGPTLSRLAEVIRDAHRAQSRVRTALAGPIATARILLVLPVAGLLLGLVLGFDTGRVLVATPPGWVCLGLGATLLGVAAGWMRWLVRTARRADPNPGLRADLVAIALSAGLGPDASLRVADTGLARAEAESADDVSGTLLFAREAGAPAVGLLRAEADDARRAAADEAERRGIALGVRLMLPLGLCILPSFVVLGVVPILLSLVGSIGFP